MKNTFKVVLALCLLASSANAVTVYGNSAQLNAAGALSDCAGAGASGGTNAKAVSLVLPPWATSADFVVNGTFVATYAFGSSTDGINYQATGAISSNTHVIVASTNSASPWGVPSENLRFFCVFLSAYTSGAVQVTIEPKAGPTGTYSLLATGANVPAIAAAGTASSQANANISNISLLTVQAAQLGINSSPAVNTQATASVAAGGASVRHIAAHCSGSIATVAAQTQVNLNLRDGATGAGTILWAGTILCPISTQCVLDSGPLNIIGTANTAMTCEWNGVPAVGNFEVANLEYKNAG